jgi:hypothetical protein
VVEDEESVQVPEIVAALSYAADLGLGQPMGHCLRQTVIALPLADLLGTGARGRETTFCLGPLANSYWHADVCEVLVPVRTIGISEVGRRP